MYIVHMGVKQFSLIENKSKSSLECIARIRKSGWFVYCIQCTYIVLKCCQGFNFPSRYINVYIFFSIKWIVIKTELTYFPGRYIFFSIKWIYVIKPELIYVLVAYTTNKATERQDKYLVSLIST